LRQQCEHETKRLIPELIAKLLSANDGEKTPRPTMCVASFAAHSELSAAEPRQHDIPVTDSPFGPIVDCNGKRELVLASNDGPLSQQRFTASLWVKPERAGALISKMDEANDYRGGDILLLDNFRIAVHLIHRWPDDAIKIVARSPIPRQQWTHVAVSYDGSQSAAGFTIYFNGVAEPYDIEVDHLRGDTQTEQPLRLGMRSQNSRLVGQLADVMLLESVIPERGIRHIIERRFISLASTASDLGRYSLGDEPASCLVRYLAPATEATSIRDLQQQIAHLERDIEQLNESLPTVMVMSDRAEPRPTYLLKRGQYDLPELSDPLVANVPGCLPPLPDGEPRNRLALAHWITSPNNPLTARVAVNRLWQKFFGKGLVASSDNFGLQGELPTHPDLLDWLAVEFVDSGWDLQHIQRLIITSNTYQQSAYGSAADWQSDPHNKWLARGPRYRLPSELLRDHALAVSGLLNKQLGGRSVMPYQPDGLWEELAGGAHENYVQEQDNNLYRRSLYVYRKRTVPHPTMATFDAPGWEICQVKRTTTNTPLQALALLNDTTYVEAHRQLAERMLRHSDDQSRQIIYAFRAATSRHPTPNELHKLEASLQRYHKHFRDHVDQAEQLLAHGAAPVDPHFGRAELAATTTLAAVILNLDEAISK
jgi:hypothetical protein